MCSHPGFRLLALSRSTSTFTSTESPESLRKMRPRWSLRNSNTFLDRWLILALLAGWSFQTAEAIDPNRTMSQYVRDRWGIESGFPGGPVYAIDQAPDGYLWLGTEKGLV